MKNSSYDSLNTKSNPIKYTRVTKPEFYDLIRLTGKSIVNNDEIRARCPEHFDTYSSLHIFSNGDFECSVCGYHGYGFTTLNAKRPESLKPDIPPEVYSMDEDKAEKYLNSRGIYGMAKQYGIGADDNYIYIPIKYKGFTYYIIRRTLEGKDFRRITYDNDFPCLFGAGESSQKTAILVESTFDKLYLSQFGFLVFSTNGLDYYSNMNIFLQYSCERVVIIPQNDEEKDGIRASTDLWLPRVLRHIKGKIPHVIYRLKGHDCNEEKISEEEINRIFTRRFTY